MADVLGVAGHLGFKLRVGWLPGWTDNGGPPRQTAWPPHLGWAAREAPQPETPAKGVEKGAEAGQAPGEHRRPAAPEHMDERGAPDRLLRQDV